MCCHGGTVAGSPEQKRLNPQGSVAVKEKE